MRKLLLNVRIHTFIATIKYFVFIELAAVNYKKYVTLHVVGVKIGTYYNGMEIGGCNFIKL